MIENLDNSVKHHLKEASGGQYRAEIAMRQYGVTTTLVAERLLADPDGVLTPKI